MTSRRIVTITTAVAGTAITRCAIVILKQQNNRNNNNNHKPQQVSLEEHVGTKTNDAISRRSIRHRARKLSSMKNLQSTRGRRRIWP